MTKPGRWWVKLAAASAVSLGAFASAFDPRDHATRADFEMDIQKSEFLPLGATRIEGKSALVTLVHGAKSASANGQKNGADALMVLVFTEPLTAADVQALLANDDAEMPTRLHAQIVLFIDRNKTVYEIKLRQTISNASVASTIASTADEAKRCFSEAAFRDGRLTLRGAGSFSDKPPKKDAVTMTWNVDLDLPVKREIQL
jgi:hypothetical protein